jgi:uncharacterized protein (DUF1778 family)
MPGTDGTSNRVRRVGYSGVPIGAIWLRDAELTVIEIDNRDMYCHCEYMGSTRDDRLQVRIDADTKRRLEDAANEVHLNLSAFVLQAARERAENILAERELIQLAPNAAAAFAAALSRPAEINEALREVLRRPKKFTWLD